MSQDAFLRMVKGMPMYRMWPKICARGGRGSSWMSGIVHNKAVPPLLAKSACLLRGTRTSGCVYPSTCRACPARPPASHPARSLTAPPRRSHRHRTEAAWWPARTCTVPSEGVATGQGDRTETQSSAAMRDWLTEAATLALPPSHSPASTVGTSCSLMGSQGQACSQANHRAST